VTVIAGIATGNVRRVLANRRHSIVAGIAGSYDLCVVNAHHWREDVGRMAVFANVGSLNVPAVFAGRFRAVMAAHTVASDIQVIEVRR